MDWIAACQPGHIKISNFAILRTQSLKVTRRPSAIGGNLKGNCSGQRHGDEGTVSLTEKKQVTQ
jgi:hypothetical protein